MWFLLPAPLLIGGGLVLLAINSFFVGMLLSVLCGKRDATPLRTLFLLPFIYVTIAILYFGVDAAHGQTLLVLFAWPITVLFIIEAALTAKLFFFLFTSMMLLIAVAAVSLIARGRARLATVTIGSFLAVFGPATLQNVLVQTQMTKYAAQQDLRIVHRHSLIQSVREQSDAYQAPHGIACDQRDWPYLWSYRQRAWMALPITTRFGGDSPERVMAVCAYS